MKRARERREREAGILVVGVSLGTMFFFAWFGFADGSPFAYITNFRSNSVSVIDTATHAVVKTIPAGNHPGGVAIHPDGSRVYVANQEDGTITIIETAGHTVVKAVKVGANASGVAVDPSGKRLYVTLGFGVPLLGIFDLDADTLAAVGTVKVGLFPDFVTVDSAGAKVYVANLSADTVSVIDPVAMTLIATIKTGFGPSWIAIHPDGSRVYVANFGSNTVSVIDAGKNAMDTIKFPPGSGPAGVVVQPDGSVFYVTLGLVKTVAVVDVPTLKITALIRVGAFPGGIDVHPTGRRLYVADEVGGGGNVTVIDAKTKSVIDTIAVGESPLAQGKFIGGPGPIESPPPALMVSVRGSGTVITDPEENEINCPGDCREVYPRHTTVTLVAEPNDGQRFVKWGGACNGRQNRCTLLMDTDKEVRAVFRKERRR